MSKTTYTTGELAALCGVTVRTVQYYDARGILIPGSVSEGGRRIYSEDDAKKLRLICFLRELGIPIDSISRLLQASEPEAVIDLILQSRAEELRRELSERKRQVEDIDELRRGLKLMGALSVENIGDMAYVMENKRKLWRLRYTMLALGFVMDALEVAGLMLWIFKGYWQLFVAGFVLAVMLGVVISAIYYRNTVYICPHCHRVFRPRLRESLFACHTPYTRKLHCPGCGVHGFCVETYGKGESENHVEDNKLK